MEEKAESTWGEEPAAPDATETDKNGGRTITVKARGKEFSVTYDMRELTPRLLKKLENGDGSLATIKEYVETLVLAWTLTDRRGNAVSLDEDGIEGVAFGTMDAIASAIMSDASPKPLADEA